MYKTDVEQSIGLISVELSGMMSPADVAGYVEDLRKQFIVHHLRSYAMVIDVSACPIQSQDMIAAMRQHMAAMPKARALAIVTGSSLARMQVRRLFTQPYARVVSTVEEGRAWVLSGVEPTND